MSHGTRSGDLPGESRDYCYALLHLLFLRLFSSCLLLPSFPLSFVLFLCWSVAGCGAFWGRFGAQNKTPRRNGANQKGLFSLPLTRARRTRPERTAFLPRNSLFRPASGATTNPDARSPIYAFALCPTRLATSAPPSSPPTLNASINLPETILQFPQSCRHARAW